MSQASFTSHGDTGLLSGGMDNDASNEQSMQLRRIRMGDLDAFHDLFGQVAAEGLYSSRPFAPPKAVIARALQRADEAGWAVFVIEQAGRIIATAEAYPDSHCRPEGDARVGVLGMQVHADWRRQGLGRRLLEAVIGHCREQGMHSIELSVFKSNHAALALYQRYGFVWVEDLPARQLPAGHRDQPQRMRLVLGASHGV